MHDLVDLEWWSCIEFAHDCPRVDQSANSRWAFERGRAEMGKVT